MPSFEEFKSYNMKTSINYIIVASDMVWQWYYDEHGTKNFRELLGREAMQFIEITHANPLKSAGGIMCQAAGK